MVQAKLSQDKHAAERMPNWAQTTQAARYKNDVASRC